MSPSGLTARASIGTPEGLAGPAAPIVAVGVAVDVLVGATGMLDGNGGVAVAAAIAAGVDEGVGERGAVAVGVAVDVHLAVGVAVDVHVAVGVAVDVHVAVGVAVDVHVAVAVVDTTTWDALAPP